MIKHKISDFYFTIGKNSRKYLYFVTAVFITAGFICGALYTNQFGFIDRVNAYILAEELMHSMIRSMTAATLMTLLIDLTESLHDCNN